MITTSQDPILKCKECDASIIRTPSEIRGNNVFCSCSCSATFYNRPKIIIIPCFNCKVKFHPGRGSRGKYCSKKCQQEFQRKQIYTKIEAGEYFCSFPGNKLLKSYLTLNRGDKCEQCKNILWEGQHIPLTVHHIDGNAKNNLPNNLKLLCWNCHALTENYGSKNKQSARKYRYGAEGGA